MAVAVTNTKIATLNDKIELTKNLATADTADLAEVFTITPTVADGKMLIGIEVGPTNGTVTWSIAPGAFWASIAAKTGSTAQTKVEIIEIETAKYKSAAGTIAITFTPASGKKLKTENVLNVWVAELK